MDIKENSFQFSYGKTEYTIALLPFLMMGISIPLLIVNVIVLLADFSTRKLALGYWGHLIGLIVSLVTILLVCVPTINQHNKLVVTENGLRVRIFSIIFYRWVEVPWQEILGVELAKRPDRWRQPLWVIKIKKLTIWHRWLSFIFCKGKHPVILISSDMENRESLLNLVAERVTLTQSKSCQ
jgi:hypothetical protein